MPNNGTQTRKIRLRQPPGVGQRHRQPHQHDNHQVVGKREGLVEGGEGAQEPCEVRMTVL